MKLFFCHLRSEAFGATYLLGKVQVLRLEFQAEVLLLNLLHESTLSPPAGWPVTQFPPQDLMGILISPSPR